MDALIFDIETDGLLDPWSAPDGRLMTRIHCIVTRDLVGKLRAYYDGPKLCSDYAGDIETGVAALSAADVLVGHNIKRFDIRAIRCLYPAFRPKAKIRDTFVCSRLIWPEIKDQDFVRVRRGATFPLRFAGKHSLEAWGHRLGVYKGDFSKTTDWSVFTPDMLAYCKQDVLVTCTLWERIALKRYSDEAIELEQEFDAILDAQEQYGFAFDKPAAERLTAELQKRRVEIDTELETTIPAFEVKYVTPKKRIEKTKIVPFQPGSRDHIAKHLQERRGWKPAKLTEGTAKPQIDESVLAPLEWPEAKLFNERFLITKALGMVAEGKKAWLKCVAADGRIHGRVNHNGAVTGRCTHSSPNIAQVPKVAIDKATKKPLLGRAGGWGYESRSLFVAGPGRVLVGVDASSLELRCLAHYMAKHDDGAFVKVLLEGDPHEVNRQAAGLDTRDQAKTFIYAFLYGAGDAKIGAIVGKDAREGAQLKARFLKQTPALAKLKAGIAKAVKERRYLTGLDGRQLHVRSAHSALNTLLQSAGALLVKRATVLLEERLRKAHGLILGRDYCNVAHIHDELQIECKPEHAELIGRTAVEAIREAGKSFGFRCPLDGEFKIGATWAATH